jgi:hypothetical protein
MKTHFVMVAKYNARGRCAIVPTAPSTERLGHVCGAAASWVIAAPHPDPNPI